MPFSVYLPKSYDGQKEYPVLYLLHGADGNHNDWMAQGMLNPYASAAEAAGGKEMIIVCPNGSPDGQNIFYCDNYQGNNMKYMTYFFDEFIPYVESNFKVKAGRGTRAIAGLSMGGFGYAVLQLSASRNVLLCLCVQSCHRHRGCSQLI